MVREHGVLREERIEGPLLVAAGPDCVHGWGGRPGDVCSVVVFQFDEPDQSLRSLIGSEGWRSVRLSAGQLRAVQRLHDRCAEAAQRDALASPVVFRIAASELSLLVLESVPELGGEVGSEARKVATALAWYESNLHLAPSIRAAAQAVHVSVSHLRRLFHKIRHISPQAAFTQVQFERATEWMRDPNMTLENIAVSSGFCSASAFSYAFKVAYGIPPKAYRASLERFPQ